MTLREAIVAYEPLIERMDINTLTVRECEALLLLGRGYTTGAVGRLLHLSPKTIETYRENIKRKLDIGSAGELIHFGTLLGLLVGVGKVELQEAAT